MAKTLTLTAVQLLILLDAMDSIDAIEYYNNDEVEIENFDKLYKRLHDAYREAIS